MKRMMSITVLLASLASGPVLADDVEVTGPDVHPEPLEADGPYSYVACYFTKGSGYTWYWGVSPQDNDFVMNGAWKNTKIKKIKKFFSEATKAQVTASCEKAKTKHSVKGDFKAAFAATSGTGKNYYIMIGSTELYPEW